MEIFIHFSGTRNSTFCFFIHPVFHRTQAEMGHTCRGTINLATANIAVEDSCNFVISNGGAQTYHLKASTEVERQRWITALELAKAKAVRMQAESGECVESCLDDAEGFICRTFKSLYGSNYVRLKWNVCVILCAAHFYVAFR